MTLKGEKMKAPYKNVVRTKQLIRNAVITLLEKKKDINLISVTDIVKTAEINRGTFYNHYRNVQDVINEIKDDLVEKLIQSINNAFDGSESVGILLKTMTNEVKANEKTYRTIEPYIPKYLMDDVKETIIDHIQFILAKKIKNPAKSKVVLSIVANGISGTYIDYLEGKLKYDLNEICEYSTEMMLALMQVES